MTLIIRSEKWSASINENLLLFQAVFAHHRGPAHPNGKEGRGGVSKPVTHGEHDASKHASKPSESSTWELSEIKMKSTQTKNVNLESKNLGTWHITLISSFTTNMRDNAGDRLACDAYLVIYPWHQTSPSFMKNKTRNSGAFLKEG